jgi:hypothetical protein
VLSCPSFEGTEGTEGTTETQSGQCLTAAAAICTDCYPNVVPVAHETVKGFFFSTADEYDGLTASL